MGNDNTTLTLLALRVRQLILRLKEMREENERLRNELKERDERVKQLTEQVEQARNDSDSLRAARLLAVADGDVEGAKKRLARLIREIDKCITLTSSGLGGARS